MIRKARDAKSSLKFVASLLSSQLPRDVQSRIKVTVQSIPEDLESEEANSLIQQVKLQLSERGYSMNPGSQEYVQTMKVAYALKLDESECMDIEEFDLRETDTCAANTIAYLSKGHVMNTRKHQSGKNKAHRLKCFICGGSHICKFCPEK